jgi:TATA-box binding protein (TBP) (component of TFIID and TFIIIB)
MQLSDFVGQPCKSRIAFEFVPKQRQALDLKKVAEKATTAGFLVETETPYVLMLKVSGHALSLFRSGKIIVKDTNDKQEARKVAEKLLAGL